MPFQNRTVFITGASRGIGKAMALRLAKEGANIIIAAKSIEEDPRLGGTIFSAAQEVEAAGGKALAVQVDIRHEDQIQAAVQQAVDKFGGIDVLINNASAIQLTPTEQTESKRFDLMQSINVRGTFLMGKQHRAFAIHQRLHAKTEVRDWHYFDRENDLVSPDRGRYPCYVECLFRHQSDLCFYV